METVMGKNTWGIYLSGEIHTDWRNDIILGCRDAQLDIEFYSPVTDHALSDDCGVKILGSEQEKFWHDNKGARLNAIRTNTLIDKSDIVIVRFGDKYRQWNAAFDSGYAVAKGKSIITLHDASLGHALKEIDSKAMAVAQSSEQVINIFVYTLSGKLK